MGVGQEHGGVLVEISIVLGQEKIVFSTVHTARVVSVERLCMTVSLILKREVRSIRKDCMGREGMVCDDHG